MDSLSIAKDLFV